MKSSALIKLGVLSFLLSISLAECMEIFDMIKRGQTITAENLMNKKDFDPNMTNPEGEALIFILVDKGSTVLARKIIAQPTFNPNVKNRNGQSLLSVVSAKGATILVNDVLGHKNYKTNSQGVNTINVIVACEEAFQRGREQGHVEGYIVAQKTCITALSEGDGRRSEKNAEKV